MKAAVCYEFNKPVVVEDVNLAPPQKGEVKVRFAATAVCHSDIHLIDGDMGGRPPFVIGHESAGYVEELGEGVTLVKPGDACVISLISSCGRCLYCTTGHPNLCETRWPLNREGRITNKKGQRILAQARVGGFAEYGVVHESQLAPIPKDMPMDSASLLACGFITGFGAVVNTAQVRPFDSVVVIGCGGLGLSAIQGAYFSGANPIIAVDINDFKLEAARKFGATHIVNSAKDKDAIETVKQVTSGRGADYVFVMVGSSSAVIQATQMTAPRGTTVIVGIIPGKEMLSFMGNPVRGERTITYSSTGSTRLRVDVPNIVAAYQAGRIKLDELITGRYPLERINDAIESVKMGHALRNVVLF